MYGYDEPEDDNRIYETIYTCLLCLEDMELKDDKCVCEDCRECEDGDWKEDFENLKDKEPRCREEEVEEDGDYLYEVKAGK